MKNHDDKWAKQFIKKYNNKELNENDFNDLYYRALNEGLDLEDDNCDFIAYDVWYNLTSVAMDNCTDCYEDIKYVYDYYIQGGKYVKIKDSNDKYHSIFFHTVHSLYYLATEKYKDCKLSYLLPISLLYNLRKCSEYSSEFLLNTLLNVLNKNYIINGFDYSEIFNDIKTNSLEDLVLLIGNITSILILKQEMDDNEIFILLNKELIEYHNYANNLLVFGLKSFLNKKQERDNIKEFISNHSFLPLEIIEKIDKCLIEKKFDLKKEELTNIYTNKYFWEL